MELLSFFTELSTELCIHCHTLIASNKQKCCFVVIMHQATLFSCFSDMHLWSNAASTTEKTDPCSVTATPAPPAVLRGSLREMNYNPFYGVQGHGEALAGQSRGAELAREDELLTFQVTGVLFITAPDGQS